MNRPCDKIGCPSMDAKWHLKFIFRPPANHPVQKEMPLVIGLSCCDAHRDVLDARHCVGQLLDTLKQTFLIDESRTTCHWVGDDDMDYQVLLLAKQQPRGRLQ